MIKNFSNSFFVLFFGVVILLAPPAIINTVFDITTVTPTSVVTSQVATGTQVNPLETSTPAFTSTITPTTTLMPLPAITLVFPEFTSTPTLTQTSKPQLATETPGPSSEMDVPYISPRIKLVTMILALLWIFLAGFLIIYIRQFK